MFKPINTRVYRVCVLLGALASLSTAVARADTVTLSPVAWGTAQDGGSAAFPAPDGHFDKLFASSVLYVRKTQGTYPSEFRAAFEFVLPAQVLQPGTTINQVTLSVPTSTETIATGSDVLNVSGYVADSTLTLSDFSAPVSVAQVQLFSGLSNSYTYIQPPYYLQLFPGSGNNRVGFVAAVSNWGTSLQWGSGATLQITYTPPTGSAPVLTVLAPADGSSYSVASNITLQATLTDAEDGGGRDWSIQWSSNISGSLGTGGNLSVTLPAGTHLITAKAVDTDGNTVAIGRVITVQ